MSVKNTFNILFYINKAKQNKEGVPTLLRITINGANATMYTKRRIEPYLWDSKSSMPSKREVKCTDLILFLETLRNKVFQAYTELSREYDDVTPQLVRDYVQGVNGGTSRTLMEIWDEHNEELKRTIGKECSYTLWQKHNTAKNHFISFLQLHYRVSDVPVRQVRYHMIREYEQFLKGNKGLKHNTTIKFLQFTKKITIRALKSGWLKVDPFADISLSLKETDRPYLTQDELDSILAKTFKNGRLDLVKDLFLFSCYTGLAYADVKKLSRSEIERTSNGMWWIKTRRQKTKERSQIPLLAMAMEIIEKYTVLSKLQSDELVLPVISNQKLNSYLKEIADIVGIEKNLTFHVARHTFATTVTLQNGVPIESVSRMMGHTNIQTTQHYARIVDKKVADDMYLMSQRMNIPLAGTN